MFKILQVINSLSSGGAEVFVTQLVKALSPYCEVVLVAYAGELDNKGTSLRRYLQDNDIEYVSLGGGSRLARALVPIRLASVINRWKPDIVHVHMVRSEQFVFLASLIASHKFTAVRTKHDERVYRDFALNRFMHSFYTKNIACSRSAYLALERMGLADKTLVLKNGIDLGQVKGLEGISRSDLRSRNGIPDGKLLCLNIGSMHLEATGFQKAQDLILKALQAGGLAEQYHVVFLGDGSGKEILQRQAVELGVEKSISFAGIVPNVMDYVACADLLVMPSRWEGLPIAAIEVACAGVPMILSNIESFDGFNSGCVVQCEVDSVDSLVSAMRQALSNLADLKRSAVEASAGYMAEFSIENVAGKHIELYKELLSSP